MKTCPECELEMEDNCLECPSCGTWVGWNNNL